MSKRKTCIKRAFTLVELLVSVAIMGLLIGILLPAVQSARQSSRRVYCQNNLKQIGLATTTFHTARGAFPPARIEPGMNPTPGTACGGEHPSWFVRIMPFLEEAALHDQWDLSQPYEDHPESLLNETVSTYLCPTRRNASNAVVPPRHEYIVRYASCGCGSLLRIRVIGGAAGDYAGNHGDPSPGAIGGPNDFFLGGNGTGVIISSRATCDGNRPVSWIDEVRFKDIKDGTSKTFLAGELHVTPDRLLTQPFNGPMYNGEDLAAFARVGGPGVPLARDKHEEPLPILGFGSWHDGVCNFVMVDGSVHAMHNLIDTQTLANLCNRADGASQ